jgi:molybdopterin-containing oxidoreductase family iron-sulfur binding subunit
MKYRWGMVIDLNKCTACGDCLSTCRKENNVTFVGPEEAEKSRPIFWMDMISFQEDEYPNPKIRLLPRPCMHCDNPPCTKVCPVRATFLNEEGLVAQIYWRCIGCRFCMVACPYTVRSFNWYKPRWPGNYRDVTNPDVSLRMRGVVEKCSFCAHRLIKARELADSEERELQEGDYVPACVENCPAEAIYFGNLLDEKSKVYKLSRSSRAFRLLEDLGTEPKMYYLAEVE